jgi:hypothetical protein
MVLKETRRERIPKEELRELPPGELLLFIRQATASSSAQIVCLDTSTAELTYQSMHEIMTEILPDRELADAELLINQDTSL